MTAIQTEAQAVQQRATVEHVLTLDCPEQKGIVHAVSGFLLEHGCDIIDNKQFGERSEGHFFMRVHFASDGDASTADTLRAAFGPVAERFGMSWRLEPHGSKRRGADHGVQVRALPQRPAVPAPGSGNCRSRWWLWSPTTRTTRPSWNGTASRSSTCPSPPPPSPRPRRGCWNLLTSSTWSWWCWHATCRSSATTSPASWTGRAINIHHSFLPSFKGAKPYHQAYARGVKTVGATAHYVNGELDEGPIIAQQVVEVDHTYGPEDLVAAGRDTECKALSNAVRWHCEGRVILQGNRTVVLR